MEASGASGRRRRILLVDDDRALGGYLSRVLRAGGFDVAHELDADGALGRIKAQQWDLLITDIELPGMSGLELLDQVRELVPALPVAVLTGRPSVDYAVSALRGAAAEFLMKPVRPGELVAKAAELIEASRAARESRKETVLAIGAHPDDVEIGAGGTLAAHGAVGDAVAILTLSRGAYGGDQDQRTRESQEAADIIGARLFLRDLPDTQIPEGNPTIGLIEQVIAETEPTIVYTHTINDLHQDHRSTHRAVMVACRRVGRVYCFQSPSATVEFRPTYFVTIDDYLGRKLKVIDAFGSQAGIRDYLEPELITSTARYWARYCAGTMAEPFETIRNLGGTAAPAAFALAPIRAEGCAPMPARRIGLRRMSTAASVAALALASGAVAVLSISAVNSRSDSLYGALIAMIVVVAAIGAGLTTVVRRGILRPFRELNQAVAAVANGNYDTRVPVLGPTELTDLSRGVELMRTRLVKALAERERAEQNLRSLFDLAPDAMLAVAGDGTIAMANAQAVQLYGYSTDDLIGRRAETLLPEVWRGQHEVERASDFGDRRFRPNGREITSAGLRRDGTAFPSEVRLSWLPTDQGTLVVAAVRDVSERLAMEAERERLRAAAEQERLKSRLQQSRRLESLGRLVGGVAHDFNNLLNVIAGYTDFAAEQLTPLARDDDRLKPVLADVDQVAAAAQQAIRVTRQLLAFSQGEAAKRELLDLNEVVETSGQLLRRSLGEHIDLVIAAGPGLWPVEADRGQLEQVLVNVALNARDAMPGGGRLTIETGNAEVDEAYAAQRPRLEPGRYCRLSVSDTGAGMDAETIERVFEPFFSTKPRGRGTGLGLATVYGIVTGVGGTIDIYSEQGIGTTVTVLLPATGQPGTEESGTEESGTEESGSGESGPAAAGPGLPPADLRGHGEMILLVEDEGGLRAMASRLLTRNGYQVYEAGSGADAIGQARDPGQRIDLLVTDMVMPGMLGNEVVDRVRAARPGLPALFITGYARQVLDFHGIPALDFDVLQKPFTEVALLTRVRRALSPPG